MSVTVSMVINVQPARSIDENLLCVFSINVWLKRSNSRRSPLCLSGDDKFTKVKFKAASYLPRIHCMRLPNLIRVLCFVICVFYLFTSCYFILSSLKLKSFGGDCWIFELKSIRKAFISVILTKSNINQVSGSKSVEQISQLLRFSDGVITIIGGS